MNIIRILSLAFFIVLTVSLPSAFDLRVQPSIIRYADYSLKPEGICVAHAWGQQLAQIVSNAFSLQTKNKIKLSSQHLIQCILQRKNQRCHVASLQNILSALDYIENYGITTQECIKNRLLEVPEEFFCPNKCQGGYEFPYKIKAKKTKHQTFNQMLSSLTQNQVTTAFIIFKVYNSMNYYSSENPLFLDQISGDQFEYRVGEVVGWKNKGDDVIVRLGSGEGWGYNGFGNLNIYKHKNLIEGMYTLNVLSSFGMRMEKKTQSSI